MTDSQHVFSGKQDWTQLKISNAVDFASVSRNVLISRSVRRSRCTGTSSHEAMPAPEWLVDPSLIFSWFAYRESTR
jgi:hypothetical protein